MELQPSDGGHTQCKCQKSLSAQDLTSVANKGEATQKHCIVSGIRPLLPPRRAPRSPSKTLRPTQQVQNACLRGVGAGVARVCGIQRKVVGAEHLLEARVGQVDLEGACG
jgi:hypothetical protein